MATQKIITIAVVALLLAGGATAAFLVLNNHEEPEKAIEYNAPSVVSFNLKDVPNKDVDEQVQNMYRGTYENKMVFVLSEIDDNIIAYRSSLYAGNNNNVKLTLTSSKITQNDIEKSVLSSISNTVGSSDITSINHELELNSTETVAASVSATATESVGIEGLLSEEVSVEATVGVELSTSQTVTGGKVLTWSKEASTTDLNEYSESKRDMLREEYSEITEWEIFLEKGYTYAVALVSTSVVAEIISFDKEDGKWVPVGAELTVVNTTPRVMLIKTKSLDFSYLGNTAVNCALNSVQIEKALELYGSKLSQNTTPVNYSTVSFEVHGVNYKQVKVENGTVLDKSIIPNTVNSPTSLFMGWAEKGHDNIIDVSSVIITKDITFEAKFNPKFNDYIPIYANTDFKKTIESNMSGKYVLAEDIVLPSNFTPIGDNGSGMFKKFSGVLDGNDHQITYSISGVPRYDSKITDVGLFARLSGTVSDVMIDGKLMLKTNATKSNTYTDYFIHAGLVAGYIESGGKILDCYVRGNIDFSPDLGVEYIEAGGVVGTMMGTSLIKDTVSEVDLYTKTSYSHLGGVAGGMNDTSSIQVCTAKKGVDAYAKAPGNNILNRASVGGIVGYVKSCGSIEYCTFESWVHANGDNNWGARQVDAGGVVGRCAWSTGDMSSRISNCTFVKAQIMNHCGSASGRTVGFSETSNNGY